MNYRFPVTVTDVFERKVQKHISGFGPNTVFTSDSAGWYLRFNDNFCICVGPEKPAIQPGEKLVLKLERSQ